METVVDTGPQIEPEPESGGALNDEANDGGPHQSDLTIDAVDRLLDEVEAALGRLDDGTYGRCATCGTSVEDSRLADAPTTLVCTSCDASDPL